MTLAGKVAILPCTGIGQALGTITRQAAHLVCEDMRPEDTVLLCLPALVRGVKEDIDMIRRCPVVVIEGCKERCAAHALLTRGGSPSATVFVPDVMKGRGVKVRREARRQLSEPELAVVEHVAEAVVVEVDRLCGTNDLFPEDGRVLQPEEPVERFRRGVAPRRCCRLLRVLWESRQIRVDPNSDDNRMDDIGPCLYLA